MIEKQRNYLRATGAIRGSPSLIKPRIPMCRMVLFERSYRMLMIIASNSLLAYNFLSLMPEQANFPLRVFLCHSSKDQSTARELYRQLKAERWIDVWFIEANFLPSQDWNSEIRTAVQ